MVHWLTQPWSEPVLQRAFLEVALIGVVGGLLGCWLVLYELAYSTESLAHALLPGLVGAALLGVPLLLGAGVGIVVAALAVALAGRTPQLGRDTAVAIVVTALLGLGALLGLSPPSPPRLSGPLVGGGLGRAPGGLGRGGGPC